MPSYPTSVNPFGSIAAAGASRASLYSERTAVFNLLSELAAVETDLVAARGASGSIASRLSVIDTVITIGDAASVSTASTDATNKANSAISTASTDATNKANAAQAAAQAASQPLDSDLTAIALVTTTPYGRGILATTNATNALTYLGTSALPGRNVLVNGNNVVRQRGNGPFTTNGYTIDGNYLNVNGSTAVASAQAHQIAAITGVKEGGDNSFFARTIVTSVAGVGNLVNNRYIIENAATLAGQLCTLSFYAKADAARPMAVEVTRLFGTGGSPSGEETAIVVYKPTLSTAWAKYQVSFTTTSLTGKVFGTNGNSSLNINFWFDTGSTLNARTLSLGQQSGTFDIDMVQLEASSVATPFEFENPQITLAKCQRYYYRIPDRSMTGSSTSTTAARVWGRIPAMRAVPTVTTQVGPYTGQLEEAGIAFRTPTTVSVNVLAEVIYADATGVSPAMTAAWPVALTNIGITVSAELP